MIISCPQCDTSYNIPDDSVSQKGRKVRCSACAFRWVVEPTAMPEPASDDASVFGNLRHDTDVPDVEIPEAFDEAGKGAGYEQSDRPFVPSDNAQKALTAATSPRAIVGWLLLLVLIVGLATFILARKQIASIIPSLTDMYEAVGLDMSIPLTLDLLDVTSEEIVDGGETIIIINGVIANDGTDGQMVPPIVVSLLDADRMALQSNIATPLEDILEAGETTTFEARFPQPPALAEQFSVAFQRDIDENGADNSSVSVETSDK